MGIQSAYYHPIESETMSADIVCISDSEDEEIPKSVSPKPPANENKSKFYNYNVYEWSYTKRPTVPPKIPDKPKEKENVVYVPDDTEETELLIGPISNFTREILFGDQLSGPSPEVPYKLLLDLEKYLNKKLKIVTTVGLDLWEYTINQLISMRLVYSETELKSDAKYNLILIRILAQYVEFRARIISNDKTIKKEEITEICHKIWFQLQTLLSGHIIYIVMVLLRTSSKSYDLAVVLYPLFEKVHELISNGRHKHINIPEILIFIITVLFYKHWLQMFTEKDDKIKHYNFAKKSIIENFTEMPKVPSDLESTYEGFIRRIDDRFHPSRNYKNAFEVFRCKIEVQKAIYNLFREYDEFVFVTVEPKPRLSAYHKALNTTSASTSRPSSRLEQNRQRQHHRQTNMPHSTSNKTSFTNNLISNNNNNSNSFKTCTMTNDADNVVRNLDDNDDDSDDIIIVEPPEPPIISLDHFDENANFSNASSVVSSCAVSFSQSDISDKTSTVPHESLNFANYNDSKHATTATTGFRRLFSNTNPLTYSRSDSLSSPVSVQVTTSSTSNSIQNTDELFASIDIMAKESSNSQIIGQSNENDNSITMTNFAVSKASIEPVVNTTSDSLFGCSLLDRSSVDTPVTTEDLPSLNVEKTFNKEVALKYKSVSPFYERDETTTSATTSIINIDDGSNSLIRTSSTPISTENVQMPSTKLIFVSSSCTSTAITNTTSLQSLKVSETVFTARHHQSDVSNFGAHESATASKERANIMASLDSGISSPMDDGPTKELSSSTTTTPSSTTSEMSRPTIQHIPFEIGPTPMAWSPVDIPYSPEMTRTDVDPKTDTNAQSEALETICTNLQEVVIKSNETPSTINKLDNNMVIDSEICDERLKSTQVEIVENEPNNESSTIAVSTPLKNNNQVTDNIQIEASSVAQPADDTALAKSTAENIKKINSSEGYDNFLQGLYLESYPKRPVNCKQYLGAKSARKLNGIKGNVELASSTEVPSSTKYDNNDKPVVEQTETCTDVPTTCEDDDKTESKENITTVDNECLVEQISALSVTTSAAETKRSVDAAEKISNELDSREGMVTDTSIIPSEIDVISDDLESRRNIVIDSSVETPKAEVVTEESQSEKAIATSSEIPHQANVVSEDLESGKEIATDSSVISQDLNLTKKQSEEDVATESSVIPPEEVVSESDPIAPIIEVVSNLVINKEKIVKVKKILEHSIDITEQELLTEPLTAKLVVAEISLKTIEEPKEIETTNANTKETIESVPVVQAKPRATKNDRKVKKLENIVSKLKESGKQSDTKTIEPIYDSRSRSQRSSRDNSSETLKNKDSKNSSGSLTATLSIQNDKKDDKISTAEKRTKESTADEEQKSKEKYLATYSSTRHRTNDPLVRVKSIDSDCRRSRDSRSSRDSQGERRTSKDCRREKRSSKDSKHDERSSRRRSYSPSRSERSERGGSRSSEGKVDKKLDEQKVDSLVRTATRSSSRYQSTDHESRHSSRRSSRSDSKRNSISSVTYADDLSIGTKHTSNERSIEMNSNSLPHGEAELPNAQASIESAQNKGLDKSKLPVEQEHSRRSTALSYKSVKDSKAEHPFLPFTVESVPNKSLDHPQSYVDQIDLQRPDSNFTEEKKAIIPKAQLSIDSVPTKILDKSALFFEQDSVRSSESSSKSLKNKETKLPKDLPSVKSVHDKSQHKSKLLVKQKDYERASKSSSKSLKVKEEELSTVQPSIDANKIPKISVPFVEQLDSVPPAPLNQPLSEPEKILEKIPIPLSSPSLNQTQSPLSENCKRLRAILVDDIHVSCNSVPSATISLPNNTEATSTYPVANLSSSGTSMKADIPSEITKKPFASHVQVSSKKITSPTYPTEKPSAFATFSRMSASEVPLTESSDHVPYPQISNKIPSDKPIDSKDSNSQLPENLCIISKCPQIPSPSDNSVVSKEPISQLPEDLSTVPIETKVQIAQSPEIPSSLSTDSAESPENTCTAAKSPVFPAKASSMLNLIISKLSNSLERQSPIEHIYQGSANNNEAKTPETPNVTLATPVKSTLTDDSLPSNSTVSSSPDVPASPSSLQTDQLPKPSSGGRRTKPSKVQKRTKVSEIPTLFSHHGVPADLAEQIKIKNMSGDDLTVTIKCVEPIKRAVPEAIVERNIEIPIEVQSKAETLREPTAEKMANRSTEKVLEKVVEKITKEIIEKVAERVPESTPIEPAAPNIIGGHAKRGTSKTDDHKPTKEVPLPTRKNPSRQAKLSALEKEQIGIALAESANEKMKKLTERRKATIFRACETIKEISPVKQQEAAKKIPERITRAKMTSGIIMSTPKPVDRRRGKRSRKEKDISEDDSTTHDSPNSINASIDIDDEPISARKNKRSKLSAEVDVELDIQKNGVEDKTETERPLLILSPKKAFLREESLRSTENSFDLNKSKDIATVPLTNGHAEITPTKKVSNEYYTPLFMKKTFVCKCNSDRDRILKRIREFSGRFPPLNRSEEDEAIAGITENVPNDCMETRTTLIKIKKIYFQRFVAQMTDRKLVNRYYLRQIKSKLDSLNHVVSIDSNVFDDISQWYQKMKEPIEKNRTDETAVAIFKRFDKFLKWWTRKFRFYCTPVQKAGKSFYESEDTISSDSNSHEREDLFKTGEQNSATVTQNNFIEKLNNNVNHDFRNKLPPQSSELNTPSIPAMQEDREDVDSFIVAQALEKLKQLSEDANYATQNSVNNNQIDESRFIELEMMKFHKSSEHIIKSPVPRFSNEVSVIKSSPPSDKCKKAISMHSPETNTNSPPNPHFLMGNDNDDSLSTLPELNTTTTMLFSEQFQQVMMENGNNIRNEPLFDPDSTSISIYGEEANSIPELSPDSDSSHDATLIMAPQKIHEILLQTEVDNYGDDNIFDTFTREYGLNYPMDPTMGTPKKVFAEKPLPVEEAFFPLVDNQLTQISAIQTLPTVLTSPINASLNSSLTGGCEMCAPLKEILDPSRIQKKDCRIGYNDNIHDMPIANQLTHSSNIHTHDSPMANNSFGSGSLNSDLNGSMIDLEYDFDYAMTYFNVMNVMETNNVHRSARDDINREEDQVVTPSTQVPFTIENKENSLHKQNRNENLAHSKLVKDVQFNHGSGASEDKQAELALEQTKLNLEDIIEYAPEVTPSDRCHQIDEDLSAYAKQINAEESFAENGSNDSFTEYDSNEIFPKISEPVLESARAVIDEISFKQPIAYDKKQSGKVKTEKVKSEKSSHKRKQKFDRSNIPSKKSRRNDVHDNNYKKTSSKSNYRVSTGENGVRIHKVNGTEAAYTTEKQANINSDVIKLKFKTLPPEELPKTRANANIYIASESTTTKRRGRPANHNNGSWNQKVRTHQVRYN